MSLKTIVILLSGKQGSGKSSIQKELSSVLKECTGSFSYSLNFADILYEMHDAVLAILHQYIPARSIVKDGPLMQLLGSDWARQTIDYDIWVKCLKAKMLKIENEYRFLHSSPQLYFIIGDCRFENEFDAFPDDDFKRVYKIRLEAPEQIRKNRCSMWRENSTHISETNLDTYAENFKFDLYLDTNENSIQACLTSIKEVVLEK
jgi:hypothetical protein